MSTVVTQTYTPSLNVSVTMKNGQATRVTLWQSNVSNSTQVIVDVPQVTFSHKR